MGFLYALLIIVCLLLILMVLLQAGKGAGAGLSIGGGMSQTMFGGSGGRDFFIKLTAGLAVAFFVLCLVLAKFASKQAGEYKGLMSGAAPAQAPAAPAQPVSAAPAKADAAATKPVVPAAKPAAPAPVAPKK
jgi:preprotein translocase subunit SecG